MQHEEPEFDPQFCAGINAHTMYDDNLNDLAWSILDYALDARD